jgi:hypothetical protein
MPGMFWSTLLNSPQSAAAGAALATSAALTDVSPAPQLQLPANFLQVGSCLRLTAFGTFSNTATPTLLLGFYYGGVAGVALAASAATTTTTAAVNWPWRMEATVTVRSTGSAGTAMAQGFVDLATSLTAVTRIPIPATALATAAVDTTTAKAITVGAQWGTSSASNTLTCHQFMIESIGL